MIVDHWMAGSFASALARFMTPGAGVSAHYNISATGRIVQLVRDEDTAYHAGNWTINTRAIGIEHEAGPGVDPTDAIYEASGWLHHHLSDLHDIPLVVGDTVIPHGQIVPTRCPGTLDLARIVREAGIKDMDRNTFNQWFDERLAESPEYQNSTKAIKARLPHRHLASGDPSVTSLPLVPPVEGAEYAGSDAQVTQVFWKYPDGTIHREDVA